VTLDHRGPVPLFHQLAEALRYRIATGELSAGAFLPSLRRAASLWGVNLHTVRRAYSELAALGVVVTSTPGGTQVRIGDVERPRASQPTARAQFIQSVLSEAKLRHGLDVQEVIALLRTAKTPAQRPVVSVVECSRTQSVDLAGQIEHRWRVKAHPLVLDGSEPPAGLVVGTYFHYNDIRLRWPERLPHVRFLPISPEADLAERLASGWRGRRGRQPVFLYERSASMAQNIRADLVRLLTAKEFRVVTRVVANAEASMADLSSGATALLSPRMWGELPEQLRQDPRVHQVRYVFDPNALDALAAEQHWEPV
jgi:DNA-binding transcriptional regulator YhcF (GntR family)